MSTYTFSTKQAIAASATILILGFASITFADTDVSVTAEVDVETKPLRPIQLLREQHENIQKMQDDIKRTRMEAVMEVKSATSGLDRKEIMQTARENQEGTRQEMRDARETFRERLQTLVKTHIGTIVRRLNAALEHFDSLVARIESRIEKLQSEGIDTAPVEASLAISVNLVSAAKTDTQALVSLIDSVQDTSDADSVKTAIRAAIQKATESVKAAHRGLLSTAKMLVALVRTSHVDTSVETSAQVEVQ